MREQQEEKEGLQWLEEKKEAHDLMNMILTLRGLHLGLSQKSKAYKATVANMPKEEGAFIENFKSNVSFDETDGE